MIGKSQSPWSQAFTEYDGSDAPAASDPETANRDKIADNAQGGAVDPALADKATGKPRMSMLDFYINRSQLCLSARDRAAIAKAKAALRAQSDDKPE
jgi:Protein of unknown function (DUF3175)